MVAEMNVHVNPLNEITDSSGPCDALTRHREADRLTAVLIGDALGLPAEAITPTHRWAYGLGWLDEGCCCVNHRFEFTRPIEEG